MIPKELQRSVKDLLDQFRQSLSNNGCNDWNFTPEELAAARQYLGDPEAWNHDYTVLDIIRKALGV